jgi:hypothetical protein
VPEFTPVLHQFTLFDFNTMRPTRKVPISAERIRRVKELLKLGDGKGAAAVLRQVREGLERYESRLFNKRKS